jgi:hypothetical protein
MLQRYATWWMLFPITGLEVADDSTGFDSPCFGDATVFSKAVMPQAVAQLRLNERSTPGHDHEKDVVWLLNNAAFRQEFHSFLAIRRSGTRGGDLPSARDERPWIDDSALRAYELSALLTLVMLSESADSRTCGLSEQLRRSSGTVTALDLEEGGFVYQTRGVRSYGIVDEKARAILSRAENVGMLARSEYVSLADGIVPQVNVLPKSLRHAVRQAAVRLADAVHSNTLATQLLGAVTALEILVAADSSDSYEMARARIAALLGAPYAEKLHVSAVLSARHRYVHRGEEPTDLRLARNAIAIALLALLRYGKAASQFAGRNALIQYLDFVVKAATVRVQFSREEAVALEAVMKLDRSVMPTPFFRQLIEELGEPGN